MEPSVISEVTQGIRISVKSIFVPEQSSIKEQTFVFAYRISIQNETDTTVQLLRRHWDIIDGWGERREVTGDGVIGQQPVLTAGEEHTYVSGSVFRSQIGHMEGFYIMKRLADGKEFKVKIPGFVLASPHTLN